MGTCFAKEESKDNLIDRWKIYKFELKDNTYVNIKLESDLYVTFTASNFVKTFTIMSLCKRYFRRVKYLNSNRYDSAFKCRNPIGEIHESTDNELEVGPSNDCWEEIFNHLPLIPQSKSIRNYRKGVRYGH